MSTPDLAPVSVSSSAFGRAINGQTAADFIGHRRYGIGISLALIAIAALSLSLQGLNLGIDFTGGVSWDVPAANGFTIDDAEDVLADNGLTTEGARLQERSSDAADFIKVQVGDQPADVVAELRAAFAEAAGVDIDDVNVNLVSASWGAEVTDAAVRALIIFTAVVAVYLSIRLEWRMAIAAIVAMLHDIVVALGIYSVLQLIVTPPTVIAFLTILGYSLYDTVVVFDRVRENEARFAAHRPPYDDVLNVSMNQVLMRSLNTSISSVVPVLSLLLIGAGLFGQSTLAEFALALLIGMVVGAYSSLLVAAPILGVLKEHDKSWDARNIERAVGEQLREMVMGGGIGSRKSRLESAEERTERKAKERSASIGTGTGHRPAGERKADGAPAKLTHPPRPRKKKRR